MHQFKDLLVWQKAIELATDVYQVTQTFPSNEKFGLIAQMRRCTISISSNIAEGAGRISKKEFSHFLNVAYGSGSELETQLIIAKNLGFLEKSKYQELSDTITEIQKMVYSLSKSLN